MKKQNINHNRFAGLKFIWTILFAGILTLGSFAQEEGEDDKDLRPVRNPFESSWMMDNQTVIVPVMGTFQMDILHRFGTINNGYDDFYGLYAPSNIKLGFNYVPVENLMVGFGFTKLNKIWDLNAKYSLVKQARKGGWPVSMTYYLNAAMDTRDKDLFDKGSHRLSYFHQLLISRKVNRKISLQVAPSISHFNAVNAKLVEGENLVNSNDHIAVAISGRYMLGFTTALNISVDIPVTEHDFGFNPEANASIGLEFNSTSHTFQIFATSFYNIIPQYNNMYNRNDFWHYVDGELDEMQILIGFNITRLWN